jgi:hypothetical protein
MRRPHLSTLSVLTALALATPAFVQTPRNVRTDVDAILRNAKFTAADIAALDSRVIARVEDGQTDTELLVAAAVRIRATRDRVAAYYGQMISYVDGQVTLAFGRFGSPPSLADVKNLSLDRDEVSALRSCRPGNCDIRVGGAAVEKLRSAVNWSAADAADQATRFARQAIVDYVAAYQTRGDAALITYNDRDEPVSLRAQWQALLSGSPTFHQYTPELRAYLEQFPRAAPPGVQNIFYWARESFGMKPIISVVHGIVYRPPSQPDRVTIVQKQIYASHYYDGSLAVASLLEASEGGGPVTYLIYGNRSRGDLLQGGFGGLRKSVARSQAAKAAEETLGTIKRVMEGGSAPTSPDPAPAASTRR